MGKKVLLSIGGATSTSSFTNDTQAQQFASTVWNLFGGGTEYDDQLRPFGSVVLDGFDVGELHRMQFSISYLFDFYSIDSFPKQTLHSFFRVCLIVTQIMKTTSKPV